MTGSLWLDKALTQWCMSCFERCVENGKDVLEIILGGPLM